MTAREMIDCVKGMTTEEKGELWETLGILRILGRPDLAPGGVTYVDDHGVVYLEKSRIGTEAPGWRASEAVHFGKTGPWGPAGVTGPEGQ
jgi:hypothetical protein